jgi:TonB family protein
MRSVLPALTILVLSLTGTALSDTEQRAAVPLHTPPLMTPVEAAATGIAPEVTVRVLIDVTGRLTEVEVVKVDPSSELDEHFERATRETLLTWRYAPAVKGGQKVESRFEWILKFMELSEQKEGQQATFGWRRLARVEEESRNYRQYILALPLEIRARMLSEHADKAMEHLDQKEKTRVTTPRFIVYSDAPDKTTAESVAQNMEATFNILAGLLEPWVIPNPEPYRVVVFVYRRQASFEALRAGIPGIEWSQGFYNPLGLIAFHLEMPSGDMLMSVMLHEATHAYLDRYIARVGVLLPRWLDEGFCDYIGGSRIKKKQLIPGKTRGSAVYRTPWGMQLGPSRTRMTLDEVKVAIKKDKALGMEEMIGAGHQAFYGEKRRQFYMMSWLLIHFLRHGEESWGEDQFPRLVLYVAEGYEPVEALRQIYGDPADLEPRFLEYVRKF